MGALLPCFLEERPRLASLRGWGAALEGEATPPLAWRTRQPGQTCRGERVCHHWRSNRGSGGWRASLPLSSPGRRCQHRPQRVKQQWWLWKAEGRPAGLTVPSAWPRPAPSILLLSVGSGRLAWRGARGSARDQVRLLGLPTLPGDVAWLGGSGMGKLVLRSGIGKATTRPEATKVPAATQQAGDSVIGFPPGENRSTRP